MGYLDKYQQFAGNYKLSPAQKLQHFLNILSKDARRIYLDRVAQYAIIFQQAIAMMNQENNSSVIQTRLKKFLIGLQLCDYVNQSMKDL